MKRLLIALPMLLLGVHSQAADVLTNNDGVIRQSLCVGFDCSNDPTFGFDTIRLKENNLRIKFEDTSTTASFPSNDWQLTANDSANGGANKFSIDDITGTRTPFTIEAGARSNSLYIDDGGRIGLGTSSPVVEIHAREGDSPTLRLEQDGSSGFAPQTWDVAGNEANFFVRDVTGGSTLPFRIRPGAPTSSIDIDQDGNIGMGTTSPSADGLEIVRAGSTEQRIMLRLDNNGAPQSEFENTDNGIIWRFGQNPFGSFVINDTADLGTAEFRVDTNGDVFVNGVMAHSSSRALKKNIVHPDPMKVLDKLSELPVSLWSYKDDDDGTKRIGPMAEDFYAAFGLGRTDRYIADSDATGVAMVAIQGLRKLIAQKGERIRNLEARLQKLEESEVVATRY